MPCLFREAGRFFFAEKTDSQNYLQFRKSVFKITHEFFAGVLRVVFRFDKTFFH